jgi:predicted nucleic-acid-binding Zn-ribbon protein
MKQSRRCPKCGGEHLLHVLRALNSQKYNATSVIGLAMRGTALAGAVLGLEPGALEAMVCKGCGFLELYVREPDAIVADGQTVVELSPPR